MGDVLQSTLRVGDYYFLAVNNSGKLLKISRGDFKLQGSVSVPQPRYMAIVNEAKMYVGRLFSREIKVINPKTLSIVNTIALPASNPEDMVLVGNKMYVCAWDTSCNKVYVVHTTEDRVTDSLTIGGRAPQSCGIDKKGHLWVLGGNAYKGKAASLTCIDLQTKAILKAFTFDTGVEAIRMAWNKAADSLYFLKVAYSGGGSDNGVYRLGIDDAALPTVPFVQAGAQQYFWGLGIDPATGYVWVGDPKGFTQRGQVSIYRPDGAMVHSFKTAVGPGHFYFDR
jgi:DNA-binding beta-propeller fold protein YncE